MKTNSPPLLAALLALLLLVPLTGLADEAREMRPDGRLSLEAQAGDFVLVGHDQYRLLIIGPDGRAFNPGIRGDASHWSVEFASPESGDAEVEHPAPIEIRMPRSAELEARVGQGALSVSGLHGPLVQIQVIGGLVRIGDSRPQRLFVETVDASQTLDSLAGEETRLRSVGGDIRARGEGRRLALQTVSGQVRLDIDELVDLELQSLSGDTEVRVRPSERAVLRAHSHSAPLAFQLPEETALDLRAESHSGAIDSAFGGTVEIGQNGNRQLVHGGGPGRVRLDLRTVEGPIEVDTLAPVARLLVFRERMPDWSPSTAIHRGRQALPPRHAEIAVGIDQQERARLKPGQFTLIDLPVDSRQLFARQSGFETIELEVVELEPVLYCFRLRQVQQVQGSREFPALRLGFEFGHVDCPDAGTLSAYEEVKAGAGWRAGSDSE
ncbi:MAG: DUF4097 family beta strand repeat-containing protein [Wenzhouxiangella sp.]